MNAVTAESVYEKLKMLPPRRIAEVEDFVEFLKVRDEKMRAQQVSELFEMIDKLAAVEPPLMPEEIDAEIDAARAERRARVDRR
ncbi:MAG: hypothetical protein LBQ20_01705 [Rhodanobacter sp.]|jgi:hypothetical protein|nr:hypothetical protein [Rhodanobacter sp.]